MTQTAAKQQLEGTPQPTAGESLLPETSPEDSRALQTQRLRLLWDRRDSLILMAGAGLLVSTLVAFLIPNTYTSTAQLMPPDQQSTSALAMMAGMAAKAGDGLGAAAGDLLGVKNSGALFVGVLRSETAQDRLVQQFDLRRVYGKRLIVDARNKLDENTAVSEDRKSGIISITVTDHSAQRAATLANAYVDELNSLVAELSTSSAHRERVFLEERLKVAKQDLDEASNQLAQFSSKNNTLDIQQESKAMLDAAGTIAGQLIAAQSQLQGLRQIYTDNNSRVRSMSARVAELRRQLEKLGGAKDNPAGDSVTLTATKTQAADPPAAHAQLTDAPPDPPANASSDLPYPTIRSFPLLGAKYSDFYRRAKIQETVFELLTQQYELAKVQEAKETPSVKVLDPGSVPEKKSFPPRLMIMALGTFLTLAMSVVWVLGSARWNEFDPQDPRKIFAQEVSSALKARFSRRHSNGADSHQSILAAKEAVLEARNSTDDCR